MRVVEWQWEAWVTLVGNMPLLELLPALLKAFLMLLDIAWSCRFTWSILIATSSAGGCCRSHLHPSVWLLQLRGNLRNLARLASALRPQAWGKQWCGLAAESWVCLCGEWYCNLVSLVGWDRDQAAWLPSILYLAAAVKSLGIGVKSFLCLTDLTKILLKIHGAHPLDPPPLPKAICDICSTCDISTYGRRYQVSYSHLILLNTLKSVVGLAGS